MKNFLTLLAVLTLFSFAAQAADVDALTQKANGGDAVAQYNLGVACIKGQDGDKDYKAASEWWRRSAKQGNKLAQFKLGDLYFKGLGVEQDFRKAYFWYGLAAKPNSGGGPAGAARDKAAAHLTPTEVADAQTAVDGWQPAYEIPNMPTAAQ